ncbi:hypothetical protein [Rhizorhabdus histidinilytica]|uniref:hypothetical protein n=1 Tax=Rhizorhabdus histidinilytica TaxID=439228 RepID=UPI00322055F5
MTDKSKPEPIYDTVWQKLLQEEAAEKAAGARKQARLDYDLAALSDWDVIRPANFQLGYNLDGLCIRSQRKSALRSPGSPCLCEPVRH